MREPDPAALLGRLTQLGPYRILGKIGQGGAGSVYAAEHVELARKVALKTIRPDYLDNEVARHRFRREMLALTRLEHPHICRVYEVGEDQGVPFMALQHLDGEDLGHRIWNERSGGQGPGPSRCVPLPSVTDGTDTATRPSTGQRLRSEIDRVVFLFEKVARAVHVAHSAGLVHRDLKPGNIMVTPAGEPVVLDFGLARSTEGDESRLSRSGDVLGTVEYMAPEQAAGRTSQVDRRSDVYALGVSLYESLCLELPFTADSRQETLVRIIHDQAVLLNRRNRAVSRDLAVIVGKAMEKESERRYQTAVELAEDLRRVRAHEPVQARPVSVIGRVERWTRRNPLAAALIATFAIGLGVSSWQFLRAEGTAVSLKQRTDQFDQLAGVVLYERAIANEKDLYPAWPNRIEAMERWLREDAGKLLAMQPEIERTVRDLEEKARPPTAAEREGDRRSHPSFAEFELVEMQLRSLHHAQAIRAGTPLILPELTPEQQALGEVTLGRLAWDRVAPKANERGVYGEEPLGLAYARLAAARTRDDPSELEVQHTLAWALAANGQDEEARQTCARALDSATAEQAAAYEARLHALDAMVQGRQETLRNKQAQLEVLSKKVHENQTFRFDLEPQQFLHDTLAVLLNKVASLMQREKRGVEQRLLWAKQIQELSLHHPNARHTWEEVRSAIATNEKYAGQSIELRDEDITGLVPIGENPVTHLWEFYELRSAWDGVLDPRKIAIPRHDVNGSIAMTAETGIVLAMLPGGAFTLGSQKGEPHSDAYAQATESPVQDLLLDPFFLARHELTRGQWERLMGTRPFYWPEGARVGLSSDAAIGAMHPAESLNWLESNQCMERHGMMLPTEAQWEYGCRAGTQTVYWPGSTAADLPGCANVHDLCSARLNPQWGEPTPFDDGFAALSPVGAFRANAFGLHDVHGNIWEWCRDWFGVYGRERPGDGLRYSRMSFDARAYRGGSFSSPAWAARSATRDSYHPTVQNGNLGLRAARALHP